MNELTRNKKVKAVFTFDIKKTGFAAQWHPALTYSAGAPKKIVKFDFLNVYSANSIENSIIFIFILSISKFDKLEVGSLCNHVVRVQLLEFTFS